MRSRIATIIIRQIIWTFGFFKFVRVKVINKENVPKTGGVVIAANHRSNLDVFVMVGVLPRHAIAIAKAELWKSPLTGWLARILGHIPVIRGNAASGKAAHESATKLIGQNGMLLIFPEGTTASPGSFVPYKPGVVRIPTESNCAVIPASIDGANKVWPLKRDRTSKQALFLQHEVTVTFGKPMRPENFSTEEEFLTELRRRIEENLS